MDAQHTDTPGIPPILFAHRPATNPKAPRILLSAGIHGDEAAGPLAILEHLAADGFYHQFEWAIFPALNPSGLLLGSRENAQGIDLNRDFKNRKAIESRFFIDQIENFSSFDLHLSLHEDWEYDKAYLYELNSSGQPSIAGELLPVAERCIGLLDSENIDGHIPTASGFICHALEPDNPQGWPEAIYLTHKFPLLSYTLETPSQAALDARIHCFRCFLITIPKTPTSGAKMAPSYGTWNIRINQRSTTRSSGPCPENSEFSGKQSLGPGWPRATTGTVLVAVLVMVVLLSFVVVAFMQDATSRIKYYGLFHNRDDLRTDAYSALETSLAVINQFREIDGQLWGPAQGWSNPLQRAGFNAPNGSKVRVRVRDESGRFGIQNVDYETLTTLFYVLDFDRSESERLADCLLDWMDDDDLRRLNGFDGDDYRNLNPPYSPANKPIKSWDELPLVYGFKEAFWDEDDRPLPKLQRFKDAFSLYHTESINLNSAPYIVRRVLEERGMLDPYVYQSYINRDTFRQSEGEPRVIRDAQEAGYTGEGGRVGVEASLLVIEVQVNRGEATFLLNALVSWSGSNPAAAGSTRTESQQRGTQRDESGQRQHQTTARSANASQLGYPFKVHALVENRKI